MAHKTRRAHRRRTRRARRTRHRGGAFTKEYIRKLQARLNNGETPAELAKEEDVHESDIVDIMHDEDKIIYEFDIPDFELPGKITSITHQNGKIVDGKIELEVVFTHKGGEKEEFVYHLDYPEDWGPYQPDSTWRITKIEIKGGQLRIRVFWTRY